jgi:C4-dicarboxylate-binding protein DctP
LFGRSTIPTLIAAITAILISWSTLAANPLTIKFSHTVAEDSPKGKMAIKFKELVAKRLNGKVQVEIYKSSQLVGDKNEIAAMLHGDVDIVAPDHSEFAGYTQQLKVFDLPFLFRDIAAVDNFIKSRKGIALLNSMESKGILGLGYLHDGLKQFTCSSPIMIPADANGLKFGIMASEVVVAQFQAVYALPFQKSSSEVILLLRTKALDGQENTFANIYSKKLYEIQPYITESNHAVLECIVVTSSEFWKSLPDPLRTEVKKALDEAVLYGNYLALTQQLQNRWRIAESKRSEIITLSEAERSQWIEVMKPVWLQFEEEIGKDLIDAAYQANM